MLDITSMPLFQTIYSFQLVLIRKIIVKNRTSTVLLALRPYNKQLVPAWNFSAGVAWLGI
jgi:hypothetical protein